MKKERDARLKWNTPRVEFITANKAQSGDINGKMEGDSYGSIGTEAKNTGDAVGAYVACNTIPASSSVAHNGKNANCS